VLTQGGKDAGEHDQQWRGSTVGRGIGNKIESQRSRLSEYLMESTAESAESQVAKFSLSTRFLENESV